MNKPIKMGDICIAQNFHIHVRYNGMECEVISDLIDIIKDGEFFGLGYIVKFSDNDRKQVRVFNLRHKKPPEDLSTWEEFENLCGFNPSKITENI